MGKLLFNSESQEQDEGIRRTGTNKTTNGYMETMEETADKEMEPAKTGHQPAKGVRVEQQPQRILPGCTQSNLMQGIKQRVLYRSEIHRLCQLLLLENRTPNKVILTNRRMPNGTYGGVRGQVAN